MKSLVCLGVAIVAVTAAGCGGAGATSRDGRNASTRTTAGADPTGGCWPVVSRMRPGDAGNSLSDIAASSPTDAWAVGEYVVVPRRYLPGLTTPGLGGGPPPTKIRPLIEHWDGRTWTRVPAPTPRPPQGDSWGGFTGVAPISSRDVWVVGSDDLPATMEHWNGHSWTVVPNPAYSDVNASLEDVAGTGPNDVWAVGGQGHSTVPIRAMIEHWNGSTWQIVPSPNVDRHNRPTVASLLHSVVAISRSDAWAVGENWAQPLVEHWNGTVWRAVKVPTDGRSDRLTDVDAAGPNDVWAAGTSYRDVDGRGPVYGIIEHFNGSSWNVRRIPGFASGTVTGLSVQSPGRVWVVGQLENQAGQPAVISRLSGGRWHEERVKNPRGIYISAVEALPSGRTWIAGAAPADVPQEAAIIQTACR